MKDCFSVVLACGLGGFLGLLALKIGGGAGLLFFGFAIMLLLSFGGKKR